MSKPSQKLTFLFQVGKAASLLSRRMSSQGLGFGDLGVLLAIAQSKDGQLRPVDLAAAVGLTASGVTRLLLPLEKIGVIKRVQSERDARVSYATITKAGKELLADSLDSAEVIAGDMIPDSKQKSLTDASEFLTSTFGV